MNPDFCPWEEKEQQNLSHALQLLSLRKPWKSFHSFFPKFLKEQSDKVVVFLTHTQKGPSPRAGPRAIAIQTQNRITLMNKSYWYLAISCCHKMMKLLLKWWFCSSGYILSTAHRIYNWLRAHVTQRLGPTRKIWTGNFQTSTSVPFQTELRAKQLKVNTVCILCRFTQSRLNNHSTGSHRNCLFTTKRAFIWSAALLSHLKIN